MIAHQRRHGFTLVELIVAMATTAMVVTAAATLAFAVSRAYGKSEDINAVASHGRMGLLRLSDRVRGARAIGYTADGCMVVWREDANGDGTINQTELTLFRLDTNTHDLTEGRYVFPDGTSQATINANNAAVTSEQFVAAAIVQTLRGNRYYSCGPVAQNVTGLTWVLDQSPPETRLVQAQLVITKGGLSQTLAGGMALRVPQP